MLDTERVTGSVMQVLPSAWQFPVYAGLDEDVFWKGI
jgi:hypothetical protein